jgi:beta-xylosidase
MYVVYGGTNVSVAQLAPDGLSQVKTHNIFNASNVGADGIEGNRLYKRNGYYYVLDDHPGDTTYIWKSSSPWGPYTSTILVKGIQSPVLGGGAPHQGSLIQTSNDDWFYMSFTWAYPAGRMPVLAPIKWGSDGFPVFVTGSNNGWGVSYPNPLPARPLSNWTGIDTFQGTSLGPAWEWNHNPDISKYTVNNGLALSTATVTTDLYAARNTLTHRIHGEFPVGTVAIDFTNMADGDRCGLAAFRDRSASIGIYRSGNTYTITVVHNMTQDESTWSTTNTGDTMATATITGKKVWLRVSLDARASGTKAANFFYSTDGSSFTQLGPSYTTWTNWAYFMGYRFGIFNYATKALGGSIAVSSFNNA